ncbi:MAG: DUF3850 domain-containing protein [Oscillospiraceae bacterium]|nr:DUF3850 domain-containing protein [Oscillospiraceae bacterium]
MIHELKCHPEYFDALILGKKTFEIRKNDRDFRVGDLVALNEFRPDEDPYAPPSGDKPFSRSATNGSYSGRHLLFEITYILDDRQFLSPGYVALALRRA